MVVRLVCTDADEGPSLLTWEAVVGRSSPRADTLFSVEQNGVVRMASQASMEDVRAKFNLYKTRTRYNK